MYQLLVCPFELNIGTAVFSIRVTEHLFRYSALSRTLDSTLCPHWAPTGTWKSQPMATCNPHPTAHVVAISQYQCQTHCYREAFRDT